MKLVYLTLMMFSVPFFLNLSMVHAASLSFFEHSTEGLDWKWFSPKTKTVSIIHTFKENPSSLYWEQDNKHVHVLVENKILTFNHHGESSSGEQDIVLPTLIEGEVAIGLWRDRTTKRLRVATRYLVPSENIEGTIEKPVLKDGAGRVVNGLATPEWGSHAILKVFEFSEIKKQWRVIATVPTKTEAGDTPGVSVLKPFWVEEGASDLKLAASKFCTRYGELYQGRQCHLGDDAHTRKAYFKRAFPECELTPEGYVLDRKCPIEDVGTISCEECRYDLLHASVEGDGLLAVLPLYLKNKMTGELTQVALPNNSMIKQVLIDQREGYSVIELTQAPGHIYVLDLNTGEIILDSGGENSIWFPN